MNKDDQGTDKVIVRKVDFTIAIVLGGLALFIFATTFNDTYFLLSDRDEVRAVLVPRILLLLIIALCTTLLLRTLFRIGKPIHFEAVNWLDRGAWFRLAGSLAVVIGIALSMQRLGFLPTMIVGIFIQSIVLGFRQLWILSLVSIISPLAVWYLIVEAAELSLPRGTLLNHLGL